MSPTIPTELRAQVRELDQDRCAYCHTPQELTVTIFEIDHITPLSQGGETTLDNLCLACPTCNRYKAARQTAPDPQTGDTVTLYHPRQQKWAAHFAWSGGVTQIEGLTPTGRATVAILHVNRPQMIQLRRLWGKLGYQLDS